MRSVYYTTIILFAVCVIALAFYAANLISENGAAQEFVSQFGVFGILVVAFISGLNLAVPIHVASFTPVFTEAGFSFPLIIIAFVIGTTLADLVGYAIGTWGHKTTEIKHPKFHKKFVTFNERHHKLILPGIFFFSAFVPLPNELILIPLGLIGFRFVILLPPLVLGTVVNQMLYAYGFNSVFESLF